jgi:hypothetical protein
MLIPLRSFHSNFSHVRPVIYLNAFFGSLSQSFGKKIPKKVLFFFEKKFLFNFFFVFRNTVKGAFQSVPRKYSIDASILRLNSSDCSNEVEDDMVPWLPEGFFEDTTVVTIQ